MMIKQLYRWIVTPYRGSNRISRAVRRRIEKRSLLELIGLPLTGVAFFGAVILPQTQNAAAAVETYMETQQTTIEVTPTHAQFHWPLSSFGISQYFSVSHPGMDLTDPEGTPIHPVADGEVSLVLTLPFGYGKHVMVTHANHLQSVYGHMSVIEATMGEKVTKETEIGKVGATGWATGNHLHLEIWQDGIPVNPMEILPQLSKN
jgi:murein DD-endopeptidase MepM/ murein hydrolase activator NlpD